MRFKKYIYVIQYQYERINKVTSIINYITHILCKLCKLCKSLKVHKSKHIASFIHVKSTTVYECIINKLLKNIKFTEREVQ